MKPTLIERVLMAVTPERGMKEYRNRVQRETVALASRFEAFMASTGYGNHGASKTKNSLIGWLVGGGSAEDDSDLNASTLRIRARDLDAGGGLARSATRTLATNSVGVGLTAKPSIDREALQMTDEAALKWELIAKREFALWAESKNADASRQFTFAQMQRLAFISWKVSGDLIGLFMMQARPGTPYETCIRLIEADRVGTPDSDGESQSKTLDNGNRIIDGVEIDRETGEVLAYYFASRHPLAGEDQSELTYTRIEAYDENGYPNVLHVMDAERPEQRRGIPFVAAMTEQLKQLDRYLASELTANIVASMFTLFIQTEIGGDAMPLNDSVAEGEKVTNDEMKIELGPGVIHRLPPGEKAVGINPMRPNTAFEKFVDTMCTQIGCSMEIPKEVLLKVFGANYSASRAALLEFWKKVKQERAWFVADFCKPIYEAVITEAVAKGRLDAPGFFDDPAIRRAWLKCDWIGSNMGQVDPKKEAEAAMLRVNANLSTQEREAAELTGMDWFDLIQQRKRELDASEESVQAAMIPVAVSGEGGDTR